MHDRLTIQMHMRYSSIDLPGTHGHACRTSLHVMFYAVLVLVCRAQLRGRAPKVLTKCHQKSGKVTTLYSSLSKRSVNSSKIYGLSPGPHYFTYNTMT
jgi:hypothetical protein